MKRRTSVFALQHLIQELIRGLQVEKDEGFREITKFQLKAAQALLDQKRKEGRKVRR